MGALTNLMYLDLSSNLDLSGTIPSEIGNLKELDELFLGGTQLQGPVPSEMWLLANLTMLALNEASIIATIPTEIGILTKLTYLDLSGNLDLTGVIPSEIGLLTDLEVLILSKTQLQSPMPSEMLLLTNLQALDLNGTLLSDEEIDEATSLVGEDGVCVDFPKWIRDCDWYAQDENCLNFGNAYPDDTGVFANQACCVCGGGNYYVYF